MVSYDLIFPLQPFTVSHLGLCAGIMVTASHNPKQDNGYKVTPFPDLHFFVLYVLCSELLIRQGKQFEILTFDSGKL